MRKYEFTAVFNVDEDVYKPASESVHSIFTDFNVKIISEDHMADRTLAYPIDKKEKGRYVLYKLEVNPSVVAELKRRLALVKGLLTSLFVKLDD